MASNRVRSNILYNMLTCSPGEQSLYSCSGKTTLFPPLLDTDALRCSGTSALEYDDGGHDNPETSVATDIKSAHCTTSCEVYQCLQSEQCLLVVATRHSRREEKAKNVLKYVLGQYQSLDTAVRKRSPRIISGKKSDGEWCAA